MLKTLHNCTHTVYKKNLHCLVRSFFMKNGALPDHHVTAELNAKM